MVIVGEWKTNLMSLAILFYFLCAQHVSDIDIHDQELATIMLNYHIASACKTDTTPTQPHRNSNTYRTKNNTINMVIQQYSRRLLMMDI